MNLDILVEKLNLEVVSGHDILDRPVSGGYVSDMLSDVLANASSDCIWITRQAHQNVIAVASLLGVAAIVLVNCTPPAPALIDKAKEEGIPLLTTNVSAYEVAGKLFALGLGGSRRD